MLLLDTVSLVHPSSQVDFGTGYKMIGCLLLVWMAVTAGWMAEATYISEEELGPPAQSTCPQHVNDLGWFREHAKTLVFMEHLYKKATEENLFNWKNEMDDDGFRDQIHELESSFISPEQLGDDCYERALPHGLIQRLSHLEERVGGCGPEPGPCGDFEPANPAVFRRITIMQEELARQRSLVHQLRLRINVIGRQFEGNFLLN